MLKISCYIINIFCMVSFTYLNFKFSCTYLVVIGIILNIITSALFAKEISVCCRSCFYKNGIFIVINAIPFFIELISNSLRFVKVTLLSEIMYSVLFVMVISIIILFSCVLTGTIKLLLINIKKVLRKYLQSL